VGVGSNDAVCRLDVVDADHGFDVGAGTRLGSSRRRRRRHDVIRLFQRFFVLDVIFDAIQVDVVVTDVDNVVSSVGAARWLLRRRRRMDFDVLVRLFYQ